MSVTKRDYADLLRRVAVIEAAVLGRPQGPSAPPEPEHPRSMRPDRREARVRRLLGVTSAWGDVRGQSLRSLVARLRAEGGRGPEGDLREVVRLTWARLGGEGVVVDPELAHLAAPDAPEGAPPPADMPEWLRGALGA